MNRTADAVWYRTVHELGLEPDLSPLSEEELRDEFRHARFAPPPERALRAVRGGRGEGGGAAGSPEEAGQVQPEQAVAGAGAQSAPKPAKKPRWRAEELVLLRTIYPTHSNVHVAKKLGRSIKSVVSKAHNMGLRKSSSRLSEMGRQNVSLRSDRKEKS